MPRCGAARRRLETGELVRLHGLSPEEARRQALIAFGSTAQHREAHHDVRGVRPLEELLRDLRHSARSLIRSPAFTLPAILLLALGIGASVALYSAIDAVLLTRLPYPHDDRLVRIFEQNSPSNRWPLSVVDFQAIDSGMQSLSAVGAMQARRVPVIVAGAEPQRLLIGASTSGLFNTLGVRPAAGRLFRADDDRPGAAPVVVVGDAWARRAFGAASAALGQSVTIDGRVHTVVGVLAPGMTSLADVTADVWPVLQLAAPQRRGPFGLHVFGRLADGATLQTAQRELADVSVRIFPIWAAGFQDRVARLTPYPLRDVLLGSAPATIAMLGVAVALVLLIAVANVTSLMLVRALDRWREVALRAVLGASRGRLLRWAITESVLLAAVGGALGLGAGQLFLRMLQTIGPRLPRLDQAHLDVTAAAFTVVLVLIIGVVVGAYPVFLLLRRTASVGLRDGARTVGGGRATHALRGALVAAEFALALPLLAGAGLLLNSFLRLQAVNPGFDPRSIYTMRVSLPAATYRGDSAIAPFWRQALSAVQQLPGVVSAGVSNVMPPLDPSIGSNNFDLLDHPVPPGSAQPTSPWPGVDAGYFGALQVPLIEGRQLNPGDSATAPPVVVVSHAWARHYFPEGNVVGRKLISGGCTTCPPTTIVGIVGDVKYNGLDSASDAVYYPMYAGWSRDMTLFVRTAAPSTGIGQQVQAVLRRLDPGLPLDDAAPMLDRLQGSVAQPRHLAGMLGAFAFITRWHLPRWESSGCFHTPSTCVARRSVCGWH